MLCVADESGKKGIKINLTAEEIAVLKEYVKQLRRTYRNDKAGDGTVAAIIVSRVIEEHPELLQEWFGGSGLFLEPKRSESSKKARREPRPKDQAA